MPGQAAVRKDKHSESNGGADGSQAFHGIKYCKGSRDTWAPTVIFDFHIFPGYEAGHLSF